MLSGRGWVRSALAQSLIVAAVALGLRLLLVSDQPYADEGVYAAISYFAHLAYAGSMGNAGWTLVSDESLGLYSLLTSWVYFLPWEPFFLLRSIDALIAAAAAAVFYGFLAHAIGDRRIALVCALFFALTANHPAIVDAGYKNSIMVAMLFMTLALALLERIEARRCWGAGVFMAAAVLFREPFAPMAAVVSAYAIARGGWYCLWRYAAGGALMSVGVVSAVLLLRGEGSLSALIASYTTFSGQIGVQADYSRVFDQALVAGWILLGLFPAALLGVVAPALHDSHRDRRSIELYLLGIGLTLAPGLEVAIKPAYAYHFAQSIPGLAILSALGLRLLATAWSGWYRASPARAAPVAVALALVAANLLLFLDYGRTFYWRMSSALKFAPVMILGDWTSDATGKSVFLRAARAIRENSAPSATMMTYTFSRALFPLTRRLPASASAGNLTRVLVRPDRGRRARDTNELLRAPPDVLVLMQRGGFFAANFVDEDRFAEKLSATYPRKISQPPGLPPYGGWSAVIFLR